MNMEQYKTLRDKNEILQEVLHNLNIHKTSKSMLQSCLKCLSEIYEITQPVDAYQNVSYERYFQDIRDSLEKLYNEIS